jgi:hypothetical protein
MKTKDQLINIAAIGGGLRLNGARWSKDDLVLIVSAAVSKNARIVIYNADTKTQDELIHIASAGPSCVFFEFANDE